jgi:hypothetical protein
MVLVLPLAALSDPFAMSKHHHHPDEGHSVGTPPASKPQGRGFFFYIAGLFILIALLCFILNTANFSWSPTVPPTPPASAPPPAK